MNCLVTAGPTYENLDEVRRLTNFSTGTLGIRLANYLADADHHVTLLLGQSSTCRIEPHAHVTQTFSTTRDLERRLQACRGRGIQAVFHAAAVCDFAFGRVFIGSSTAPLKELKSPKFPTRHEPLLVELVPTPKLIANLHRWFPAARIVGWKFEVVGDRRNAIATARHQIAAYRTDACVLNGPAYGDGYGWVTARRGPIRHLPDPTRLFEALRQFIERGVTRCEAHSGS
jgi:phosphopantothenoylcysteine decarboxylase/phosphopantothenate--cysteine ligase